MSAVWKYPLAASAYQEISMPHGAQPLTVALQDGTVMVWVLIDPDEPEIKRGFYIRGTGDDLDIPADFVGTAFVGAFVFHVFADPEPGDSE